MVVISATNLVKYHWKRQIITLNLDGNMGCFLQPFWSYSVSSETSAGHVYSHVSAWQSHLCFVKPKLLSNLLCSNLMMFPALVKQCTEVILLLSPSTAQHTSSSIERHPYQTCTTHSDGLWNFTACTLSFPAPIPN